MIIRVVTAKGLITREMISGKFMKFYSKSLKIDILKTGQEKLKLFNMAALRPWPVMRATILECVVSEK